MRVAFAITTVLELALATPAAAQIVIGTTGLGQLGMASGSVAYPAAGGTAPGDRQIQRFTFDVTRSGTLTVDLLYQTELRSPLVITCDPEDPDTCTAEPSGDYQPYQGVDLTGFAIARIGGGTTALALPTGFEDRLFGGPGQGYPTYGFDYIAMDFALGRDFALTAGSYIVDLAGFGLIPGPDFANAPGGGSVAYAFSFAGVPEPASWLAMILGLGMIGVALRTRRRLAFA